VATIHDLNQLRSYVTDVAECAAALDVHVDLIAQRDEFKQLANQILTELDEPLRIGFLGEFSAGKSLLLGVLVGQPDLLPTGQEPLTGNVTEIRFRPRDEGAQGLIVDGVEVCFFSPGDADLLSRSISGELRAAAERAGLSAAELAEFDALAASWTPQFRDWCARISTRNQPELRKLIREMIMLRDAMVAAPDWLGRAAQITWEQLGAILKIRFPLPQGNLPSTPYPNSVQYTSKPTSGQLGIVFPLVSRVILNVTVPSDAWPVAGWKNDQGFTLLDFPGIGGANSKVRDLFLTRRGLEEVHTILVLVNAAHPGGQVPDSFYGFLSELEGKSAGGPGADDSLSNRIVYCAGRFDELKPPKGLLDDPGDTSRMTMDRLLNASGALNVLLDSGHQPGLSAMRAFASSLLAIARLGLNPVPAELDVEGLSGSAERGAQVWLEIAESLRSGGTGGTLVTALLGYAADGGIGELQRLLDQHVRDHGLDLRYRKTQRRVDELDELKERLQDGLRANQPVPDAAASPWVRVTDLVSNLRERRQDIAAKTPELLDTAQLMLQAGGSVQEDVSRKAADLVMGWPQWDAIFKCVHNSVVVPSVRSAPPRLVDRLGVAGRAVASAPLPQRLGEFQDAFDEACREMRGYARAQGLAATRHWLAEKSNGPSDKSLRQRSAALLDEAARERLARQNPTMPYLLDAIGWLLRPEVLADVLADEVAESDPGPAREPSFPMRAEQLTRWADGTPADESMRHFIRVSLLRSALIDGVTGYALDCLDTIQDFIVLALSDVYKGDATDLPDTHRFATAVLGSNLAELDEPPDPAAELASLRRPDRNEDSLE
jgi:hypothetical protein